MAGSSSTTRPTCSPIAEARWVATNPPNEWPVTPCRQRMGGQSSGPHRWTFSITVGCRMAVIEAEALQKRFGDVEAVQGISFAVEAGERLAYIGPNGAGKSTSIKMLTGIL